MSTIKAGNLAYARVQVPDLVLGASFLLDFGLLEVDSDRPGHRFFRASDPTPFSYELVEGPQRFLGFGFDVVDRETLERAAAAGGVTVEAVEGPGGGDRVRLVEPNGYAVDLIFGRGAAALINVRRPLLNTGAEPLLRKGELYRAERGAVLPVKRLAHVVLGSPQINETIRWFQDRLGLLMSDEIVAGPDQSVAGAFMRLDAGDEFVDHHTVFLVRAPVAGLHHISFEAHDVDALLAEHSRLKASGRYTHMWGIGRHTLGSQIFDYWSDPFGYMHEHWADTDRLNASTAPNRVPAHEGMVVQWGEPTPDRVRQTTRP